MRQTMTTCMSTSWNARKEQPKEAMKAHEKKFHKKNVYFANLKKDDSENIPKWIMAISWLYVHIYYSLYGWCDSVCGCSERCWCCIFQFCENRHLSSNENLQRRRDGRVHQQKKKIIELQQINANDTTKMTTIIISATVLHCKKNNWIFSKLRIIS